MTGENIAVFGAGRSGLAIASAARKFGANATIFDERPAKSPNSADGFNIVGEFDGIWPRWVESVVTSPGVPKNHPSLLRAVEMGIPVLSEIEFAYQIAKAPIVAITGTNGKSTTTVMTYICLLAIGVSAVLCGNIYGTGYDEIPLTEAAATSGPDSILVAEVSSFQLEWIDQFRPRAATITNISDDHLNRYTSFEDYRQTKLRIYENMGIGDTAVWHSGDESSRPPSGSGYRIASYGSSESDARIEDGCLVLDRARIEVSQLPFSEPHNLLNAMAAVLLTAASAPNPDAQSVLNGLKGFRPLAHRMQIVGERGGVLVINNSMCTNPAAVVASSSGIARRQHLLVGGVDKDMNFAALAEYLASSPHRVYAYGRDAEQIVRQLGGMWPVFNTMQEAFEAAAQSAVSGEAIMLAPGAASMDQFKDFRDRGEAFTAMAKEWLES